MTQAKIMRRIKINNKIIQEMMSEKEITIKKHLMNKIQAVWNLRVMYLNLELMNNWKSMIMMIYSSKKCHKN